MFTQEETKRLVDRIFSYSKFPECSVSITSTEQTYTRFANNAISLAGFSNRHSISVHSTREQKTGVTQTSEIDEDSLRGAVKRSEEISQIAPANPEHSKELGPQNFSQTAAYDEETARARSPQMIPQIRAIVQAAAGKKLMSAGLFERSAVASTIANKSGLFGFHRFTDARLSTTVRAADGSSSGWAGQPSVRIREIDGAALADRAVGKCLKWKNPKRLDPGQYTVVLEPSAAGDLIRLMSFAFDARSTEEGRTFLSKKGGGTLVGEKLFPEMITLRSDPFDPRLPAAPWTTADSGFGRSAARQSDWLPSQPVLWIEKGVVRNLYNDRYWAEKTKKPSVPFPSTLILDGTEASTEDLIASVDRGLLVTRFWYIRFVNPKTLQYTGLTRDGLFLIEKGKISEPVMNFRFNESPVRLLENTRKLSRSIRMRGSEGASMIAPGILAEDFTFTSISDAV